MIKVLNIISDTNIGGAGRALLNYLAHYDKKEFENAVILPLGSELKPRLDALGVRVIEADIAADKSFSPKDTGKLKALIKAEAPDVVHTHGSLTGRMAAKRSGVRTVVTRHSAFPFSKKITKTPLKLGYKYLYEHYADRIIAISPAGAELLYEIGVRPERVDVMMNGAEPVSRLGDMEREELRRSFGVDKDTFLEDAAIMAGFRPDVGSVLSAMDLQLNASYVSETSSLSIIEGFSISLPALCSRTSGNPYLVNEGVSGLLFEPRSAEDMAAKIRLVMDSPELYSGLSRGALREYEKRFTGERFAADLEKVYKKALEMGKNGK